MTRTFAWIASAASLLAGFAVHPVPRDPRISPDAPRDMWATLVTVEAADRLLMRDPDGHIFPLRLLGCAAPHAGQPYREEGIQAVRDLLDHQEIPPWVQEQGYTSPRYRVFTRHADSDDVTCGYVVWVPYRQWDDGRDHEPCLNDWVVTQGWCWCDYRWSKDANLALSERTAWELRRGVWQDDRPTPPWEFAALQR